jgi:hypothetical protein
MTRADIDKFKQSIK